MRGSRAGANASCSVPGVLKGCLTTRGVDRLEFMPGENFVFLFLGAFGAFQAADKKYSYCRCNHQCNDGRARRKPFT